MVRLQAGVAQTATERQSSSRLGRARGSKNAHRLKQRHRSLHRKMSSKETEGISDAINALTVRRLPRQHPDVPGQYPADHGPTWCLARRAKPAILTASLLPLSAAAVGLGLPCAPSHTPILPNPIFSFLPTHPPRSQIASSELTDNFSKNLDEFNSREAARTEVTPPPPPPPLVPRLLHHILPAATVRRSESVQICLRTGTAPREAALLLMARNDVQYTSSAFLPTCFSRSVWRPGRVLELEA